MGQTGSTVGSSPSPPPPIPINGPDLISLLPDEILSLILLYLSPSDRTQSSLVSRAWLRIEAQTRTRLSLLARPDISPLLPSLFTRFRHVTTLSLRSDRRSDSINDQDLFRISLYCPNLTRLKLRACSSLTPSGMSQFAKHSPALKKLSIGSLNFGANGINAVLHHSPSLESLSVKRLRSGAGADADIVACHVIGPTLKSICLKEIYNGQCFGPLVIGSRNLKRLKLFRCSGDWDKVFEAIADRVPSLVEIHLERVQVSDAGLVAISNCLNLEILHIVKTPECTNLGLKSVVEKCKLLRKLHIDGWKTNRIGDDGLISVARHCFNLQELVLIGVNPTVVSLAVLATNCVRLERLALCGSDTVGDTEISCISTKCAALKKLCIKSCAVSDLGMEALANGCPNLVKVKVKKCKRVTIDGADWLRASRRSLTVNIDVVERENLDRRENEVEVPGGGGVEPSTGRSRSFKARLGLIAGRNLVSGTLRRWSSFGGGSSSRNG